MILNKCPAKQYRKTTSPQRTATLFCPSPFVHLDFLPFLSPAEVSEWLGSFQQAKWVVNSRHKIDFNQRACNYIAVVVTDADNSQPSYLPVLHYDYIFFVSCLKPVSFSVGLHLTLLFRVLLLPLPVFCLLDCQPDLKHFLTPIFILNATK